MHPRELSSATQETETIQAVIAMRNSNHSSHQRQKGHLSFALM
jgi:hypothetical protein